MPKRVAPVSILIELLLIKQLATHDAIDLGAQFSDAIFVGKLHFGLPTDQPGQDIVTECMDQTAMTTRAPTTIQKATGPIRI